MNIPRLLPYVFLADSMSSPPGFRFRLVGTEIINRGHFEFTGKCLDALYMDQSAWAGYGCDTCAENNQCTVKKPDIPNDWIESFSVCAEKKIPFAGCDQAPWLGDDKLMFEWILMPLSSNGTDVDKIMGGMIFLQRSHSVEEALEIITSA